MRLKGLGIVAVPAVLALVGAYLVLDIFASERTMQFDKALWVSAWQMPVSGAAGTRGEQQYPRKAMLKDLLDGPLLKPGMSKAAVIELLGSGQELHEGKVLSYLIGPSDWSVDFDNLVLEFDTSGSLVQHYLWAYDTPPPYPRGDSEPSSRAGADASRIPKN
jgi:hypothetical protein